MLVGFEPTEPIDIELSHLANTDSNSSFATYERQMGVSEKGKPKEGGEGRGSECDQ